MANAITGEGNLGSASEISMFLAASTSPAWVSFSLATAPMSPGPNSSVCPISLPCGSSSWPMRSFVSARRFITCESWLITPW